MHPVCILYLVFERCTSPSLALASVGHTFRISPAAGFQVGFSKWPRSVLVWQPGGHTVFVREEMVVVTSRYLAFGSAKSYVIVGVISDLASRF